MNMITQGNIVRVLKTSALAFVLVFSTGGMFPIIAHAQYSGDANCCGGSDVYDMYVSPQTPAQQDIYDLYVSPQTPAQQDIYDLYVSPQTPAQQDIYDLYVSPQAPTTPGTVTVESVPVYTNYDA